MIDSFVAKLKEMSDKLFHHVKGKIDAWLDQWSELDNAHVDFGRRHELSATYVETKSDVRQILTHHRQSTALIIENRCDNSLGHLLLEGQRHWDTAHAEEARFCGHQSEPFDNERRGHVEGQVAYNIDRRWTIVPGNLQTFIEKIVKIVVHDIAQKYLHLTRQCCIGQHLE